MTPKRLFERLLARFGPRGWWPLTRPGEPRPIYEPGRPFPRTERARLEIAVGAILTQGTSWKNVERALENLHRAGAMGTGKLRRAPFGALERWVRPSGYFRQKARKLRGLAEEIERAGGRLAPFLEGPLPTARRRLLALWGVGPETADSILLYAGGRRTFVVDAYTLRVGRRIGWFGDGESYEGARAFFERSLRPSPRLYAEFHALLVELAKRHCRTRPLCGGCPAATGCQFAKGGRIA